jgi:hypothetical protein
MDLATIESVKLHDHVTSLISRVHGDIQSTRKGIVKSRKVQIKKMFPYQPGARFNNNKSAGEVIGGS